MYFNENKENTNIDSEFKGNNKFDIEKYKKPLIIGGGILLFIILLIIIIILLGGRQKYYIRLMGEQTINIYQGVNYVEPGYYGYNRKGTDLTSQVVVKDNIDTQSIGTYTVIYTLHNTTKKRTINVVDRPSVITMLYLNGDKTINLKVGDEYKEPGYSAIDAIDGDITSKVTTQGTADTSKKGTYRIVYSVVNSENITTSETRVVVVE